MGRSEQVSRDSRAAGPAVPAGVWRRQDVAAPFCLTLLGLAMLVASFAHGFAQARAGSMPEGVVAVVICADGAAQTILLDRNGNPVEPAHCLPELCSACLSPPLLENASQPAMAPRRVASRRMSFLDETVAVIARRPASDPRPRGPPPTI